MKSHARPRRFSLRWEESGESEKNVVSLSFFRVFVLVVLCCAADDGGARGAVVKRPQPGAFFCCAASAAVLCLSSPPVNAVLCAAQQRPASPALAPPPPPSPLLKLAHSPYPLHPNIHIRFYFPSGQFVADEEDDMVSVRSSAEMLLGASRAQAGASHRTSLLGNAPRGSS